MDPRRKIEVTDCTNLNRTRYEHSIKIHLNAAQITVIDLTDEELYDLHALISQRLGL